MLEVEIKARCNNINDITEKIEFLGGIFKDKLLEKDIYFQHPGRDFSKTDEAFRLRIQNNKNKITYKGPKISKLTKTRLELETEFSDFETMQKILENLGFKQAGIVEKERNVYKISDIEICIDDVKNVGKYIELEKIGEDKDKIEKELFSLAAKLDLKEFEMRSYLELLLGNQAV